MSKKGFLSILKYIARNESQHYIDIQKYATRHIAINRSQVDVALSSMSRLGLIEREVLSGKPIRTKYRLTKNGRVVLESLDRLETI